MAQDNRERTVDGIDVIDVKLSNPLSDLVGRDIKLSGGAGGQWTGLCPFHAEKTPSFTLYCGRYAAADHFHCFGCGAHGDAITYVQRRDRVAFPEAVRRLATHSGIRPHHDLTPAQRDDAARRRTAMEAEAAREARNTLVILSPVPADAPPILAPGGKWTVPIIRPQVGRAGNKPRAAARVERLHAYRDADGELLGHVVRTSPNPARGIKKAALPVVFARGVQLADGTVGDGWTFSAMPVPRVPYGVHLLAQARRDGRRPVCLVVEGEKNQEDAQRVLGDRAVSVSWVGGANAWGMTDWAPLVGWDVVFWPDNDAGGREAMQGIANTLARAGTDGALRWIEPPPSQVAGWDVSDAIEAGWDRPRIEGAIAAAGPVPSAAPPPSIDHAAPSAEVPAAQPTSGPRMVDERHAEILERVRDEYPIPSIPGDGTWRYVMHDGAPWLVREVLRVSRGHEDLTRRFACTPVVPIARVIDADGRDSGKRFRVWTPEGGRPVTLWGQHLSPRGLSDAIEQFERLASGFEFQEADEVGRVLHAARAQRRIRVVKTPGWHHVERPVGVAGPPVRVFVTRSGEIIQPSGADAAETACDLELDANAAIPPLWARSGNRADWMELMEEVAAADRPTTDAPSDPGRLPHVIIGILMGLAGPLAQLAQQKSWGVVLSGAPGRGKTTSLLYAGAVWGSIHEAAPNSAHRTMGATLAGAEILAATSTGTVCCLDEAAQSRDVSKLPQLLYKLSSNQGDVRSSPAGGAQTLRTWSTLVLVSAEHPLRSTVEGSGAVYQSGLDRRYLDLNVGGLEKLPAGLAERITSRVSEVFGVAGPEFVRHIINQPHVADADRLRRIISEGAAGIAPADAPPVLQVAAQQLMLLRFTAETARAAGLLPMSLNTERALAWAWVCVASGAGAMSDAERGILNLRRNIAVRLGGTMTDIQGDPLRRPAVVDGWFDERRFYIPTDVALRWAGNGLSNKALFEALDNSRLIAARGTGGRGAVRSLPDGVSMSRGTVEVPPEAAARGGVITADDVTAPTLAGDAVRMVLRASGVYVLDRAALDGWMPACERREVDDDLSDTASREARAG